MTGLNDKLVDFVEEFGCEQADIVFECLEVVANIIKHAMTKDLAKADVLVHEFMQAIVVTIQIKPYHATNKNRPQSHTRATIVFAHIWGDLVFQQLKYRRP